jgi:hypothetical protein
MEEWFLHCIFISKCCVQNSLSDIQKTLNFVTFKEFLTRPCVHHTSYEDIHHSSVLKLAIEKAIQKSTNANLASKLFQDDSNDEKNQFVGFVSSHKKGTLLTSFHIHSFVVFHTDLQKNTIETCILTAQNLLMSTMQD